MPKTPSRAARVRHAPPQGWRVGRVERARRVSKAARGGGFSIIWVELQWFSCRSGEPKVPWLAGKRDRRCRSRLSAECKNPRRVEEREKRSRVGGEAQREMPGVLKREHHRVQTYDAIFTLRQVKEPMLRSLKPQKSPVVQKTGVLTHITAAYKQWLHRTASIFCKSWYVTANCAAGISVSVCLMVALDHLVLCSRALADSAIWKLIRSLATSPEDSAYEQIRTRIGTGAAYLGHELCRSPIDPIQIEDIHIVTVSAPELKPLLIVNEFGTKIIKGE
ncbi:hypothetical protein Cgig2_030886 [Carnegiea gigantea]|uniref:Uncharacterized protein n=1 Tax=Carnegiea gigantea TaxID=171969 RepID=A0A9Q1KHU8_9CARY|nr:hypothetical protein Cgig2_030886 [Carnegiea gigantea]